MTDRRTGTICLIHLTPFQACPCDDRRNTTDAPIQVVCCDTCGKHFTECACPQPDLQPRSAA